MADFITADSGPLPKAPKPDARLSFLLPNLLETTLAQPFNQTDWRTIPRPPVMPLIRDLVMQGFPLASATQPFAQLDWPNPPAKPFAKRILSWFYNHLHFPSGDSAENQLPPGIVSTGVGPGLSSTGVPPGVASGRR